MKLSVVIPVYGVEDTLDRCVESVLRQQVDNMEVILVDDGSPDKCPEKCDSWALRDERIKVIHQQNGGLSDARNKGIEAADGTIITFVDSDDWLAPGTYRPLLETMRQSDILEYSMAEGLALQDRHYDDTAEYWLSGQAYRHTYACNKLFRRSLFDSVRFPVGRVFEDAYTLPQLLRQARKVTTMSHGSYHYSWNPNGITAKADGQALAQLLDAHLHSGMPIDDTYYMYLANIQIDVWEQAAHSIKLPSRHIDISQLNHKQKIKAIAINTLGLSNLCKISKFIHHFRNPSRSSHS